jgi:hypothetical protein
MANLDILTPKIKSGRLDHIATSYDLCLGQLWSDLGLLSSRFVFQQPPPILQIPLPTKCNMN